MPLNPSGTLAVVATCLPLLGCGWFGGDVETSEDDVELETVEAVVDARTPPAGPPREEHTLELNLRVGDRFPLVKTVEQTLAQATPQGDVVNRSRLRLQLAIVVQNVHADGSKTLGVRYHRVGYEHDVAGERIDYDSAVPSAGPRPPAVQAYHGLVGNGFSFVVGPDNRIKQVHDFRGFLTQCLRDVPVDRRNAVLAELEAAQGEEGIANFVDDSIGLLPYDPDRDGRESMVAVNQEWTRRRQIVRPVPLSEETTYALTGLHDDVATIDVTGSITPSSTFGPSGQLSDGALVFVTGGYVHGECTIRRSTGLPVRSRIERNFKMVVRFPDTTTVEQRKRVVTTIETYEEQGVPHSVSEVVPASAVRSPGKEPPVVPARFASP